MKRPTIAVDIDDVIADSTEALRVEVNNLIGVNLTRKHYSIAGDYWGYYEYVWAVNGLADKVSFKRLQADMTKSQKHVLPIKGAAEALSHLSQSYEIVIVTSRDLRWRTATLAWLNTNFPDLFRRAIFVKKKGDDARTKGIVCREIGADWLIDDNVEHCQSALDEGVKVILFGHYGWQLNIPPALVRCSDWESVRTYINAQS